MDFDKLIGPRVLLIGHRMSWGWSLIALLEELGCRVFYLTAREADLHAKALEEFDLILGGSDCSHAVHLSPAFAGSHTTVFYLYPVEDGCWWLPALRQGTDCYGSPALRRAEFAAHLKEVLRTPAAMSAGK